MVTATASVTPTKVFLNRWVKQLIPELVKMNAVTESGVAVITHWMEATVAELENSIYQTSAHPEAAQRSVAQMQPAAAQQVEGPWSAERVIRELAESQVVTHVVFGAITSERGHRIQGVLGAGDSGVVKFADSELQRKGLFMESWDNYFQATFNKEPFRARLTAPRRVGDMTVLKLCFNDYTGDSRESSHTDYTVGFPGEWGGKIVPTIARNPEVLILLFQRLFPSMDRSKGQLQMDPNWKKFYFKCAEYDQQDLWPTIERLNWN